MPAATGSVVPVAKQRNGLHGMGFPRNTWSANLRCINRAYGCELDSVGLGSGPLAGSCKRGFESRCSVQDGDVLDQLSDYQRLYVVGRRDEALHFVIRPEITSDNRLLLECGRVAVATGPMLICFDRDPRSLLFASSKPAPPLLRTHVSILILIMLVVSKSGL